MVEQVTSVAIAEPDTLTMGRATAPILGGVAEFRNLKVERERESGTIRKRVALKRTVAELRTISYTNLYQLFHRNGHLSRTFELRIVKFKAVD